ncbi:TetR family transcriptional regulator [bacterium]|nr:TetR family transcriptional regulator [bacterium]
MISSERRQSILDATLAQVAETGLTGTTMALIAKRAEASPGIIYHYFASKDEILHTLFNQIFDEFAAAIVSPELLDLPWQDRYCEVWLRTFHFFAAHPHKTAYYEQYKNSAYADYNFDAIDNEHMMALVGAVQADIAAGHILALPMPVIHTLIISSALNMAKLQISGAVHFDAAMLDKIAQIACQSLIVQSAEVQSAEVQSAEE